MTNMVKAYIHTCIHDCHTPILMPYMLTYIPTLPAHLPYIPLHGSEAGCAKLRKGVGATRQGVPSLIQTYLPTYIRPFSAPLIQVPRDLHRTAGVTRSTRVLQTLCKALHRARSPAYGKHGYAVVQVCFSIDSSIQTYHVYNDRHRVP